MAISSLMKEAMHLNLMKGNEVSDETRRLAPVVPIVTVEQKAVSNNAGLTTQKIINLIKVEENAFNKRLLSKYGCFLAIKLINPEEIHDIVIQSNLNNISD